MNSPAMPRVPTTSNMPMIPIAKRKPSVILAVLILAIGGLLLLSSLGRKGQPPAGGAGTGDAGFHQHSTYTNTTHGYRLQYPGWWVLDEGQLATVIVDPTGTAVFSILVREDPMLQDSRGADALIALTQERFLADQTLSLQAFQWTRWNTLPAYRATGVTKTDERFIEDGIVTGGKLVVLRSTVRRPHEEAFAGSFDLIRESFALTSADAP